MLSSPGRSSGYGRAWSAKATLFIVVTQIIVAYTIELFGWFGVEKAPFEWRKPLAHSLRSEESCCFTAEQAGSCSRVTVQYPHSYGQKSIENCLRQWDFACKPMFSYGQRSECADLLNSYVPVLNFIMLTDDPAKASPTAADLSFPPGPAYAE